MTETVINAFITNIINNIFHVIWFICLTLEPRYNRKKTVFIITAVGVFLQLMLLWLYVTGILGWLIYPVGYVFVAAIFGAVYIFGVSVSHPAKSVFIMSGYYCLWTFIYSMTSLITDSFVGDGSVAIWLLRVCLNLFFLFLYQFFLKKHFLIIYQEIKYGDGGIALLSLMTFYMLTLLLLYNEGRQGYSAFYLCMLFSVYVFMVVVYMVLFRFLEGFRYERQTEQMKFHERLIHEQMDSYEKLEQSIKQTRHDFRHHIIVVAEFAQNKDYQGILDYLQEYEERETEKYEKTFCSNHAVDHVLSAYVARAEEKEIQVDMDIQFWDTSGISNFDLVSLLANIMENAIHGCLRAEGKWHIGLSVRQKGTKLVIVCKNTCIPDILFENGIPKNQERDSVGVASILQTAGKYSGNVDFFVADNIFTCQIILSLSAGPVSQHTRY